MTPHIHEPRRPATEGPPPILERLLDEREAAKFLGVSPRTLWGLASRGEVPYVRIGKTSKRYDPRDLRAFCDRNRVAGPAAPEPGHEPLENVITQRKAGVHHG